MKKYVSGCELFSLHMDTHNTSDAIVKHQLHAHNKYEFYYLKQGTVKYIIEQEEYIVEQGDIMVVNHHEYHSITMLNPDIYDRIVVQVDELFLAKMMFEIDVFDFFRKKRVGHNNKIPSATVKEYGLDKYFFKLSKLTNPTKENDIIIKCTMIEMLIKMEEVFNKYFSGAANKQVTKTYQDIVHYINENIEKRLSLDLISKELFLTKYYLCHEFKKHMGMSINEYILNKKVLFACSYIKQGMPANEACFKTGFNSYQSFHRVFVKILKCSPSKVMAKK